MRKIKINKRIKYAIQKLKERVKSAEKSGIELHTGPWTPDALSHLPG